MDDKGNPVTDFEFSIVDDSEYGKKKVTVSHSSASNTVSCIVNVIKLQQTQLQYGGAITLTSLSVDGDTLAYAFLANGLPYESSDKSLTVKLTGTGNANSEVNANVSGARISTRIEIGLQKLFLQAESATIKGFGYYFGNDLSTLIYSTNVSAVSGYTGGKGTITPDFSGLKAGSNTTMHLVVVYDTGVEVVGTWTVTMA